MADSGEDTNIEKFDLNMLNDIDPDSINDKYDYLFVKKPHFTIRFLKKDLEISTKAFFLLLSILISFVYLEFLQISFYQASIEKVIDEFIESFIFTFMIGGVFTGLVVSVYMIDKINKPLRIICILISSSFIVIAIQLILGRFELYNFLAFILFLVDSAFNLMGIMICVKLFIVKTTVLERGRVWAYLFLCMALGVSLLLLSLFILPLTGILFIPLVIIYLVLSIRKHDIHIYPNKPNEEKESFKDFGKFYWFLGIFSLTAGFATSFGRSSEVVISFFIGNSLLLALIIIALVILSSVFFGVIFDYFGRTPTLAFIITGIVLANYTNYFDFVLYGLTESVIISTYISIIMVIPLYIGDLAKRNTYGKHISISYTILLLGLSMGMLIRAGMTTLIENTEDSTNLIIGTTFVACAFCYLFLLSMRETLPKKEQEWKDNLIHLYVIHISGILIYDYAFHEKGEESESLLISGGIVGIVSILKEIIKGNKEVKTIDHQDRKLLLQSNPSKTMLFALLVKDELNILRHKLDQFSQIFDQKYDKKLGDMNRIGLAMEDFKDVKVINRRIFGL